MKRLSFLAMFIAMVLGASAQYHMHLWIDGVKISYPVLNLDSITFTDEAIEEPEEPTEPFVGVFSVSPTKYVTFSPGNLQYTQSTNTWSFASAQWEMLGTDNVTGGSVSSDPTYGDKKEGTALADKVDLFGWSTSATYFGVNTSEDWENAYSGSFVDWGTNTIDDYIPNTWRTLSKDEWEYLLNGRNNATSLCGVAQVNGVNGLIFLPDNWTCPAGVTFKSGFHSNLGAEYYAAYQTFTVDQWSKLESTGAIFLPAAGYRVGTNVYNVQHDGHYWSTTKYGSSSNSGVHFLFFTTDIADIGDNDRYLGHPVRLVKDVKGETTEPEIPGEDKEPETPTAGIGVFSVGEGKTVTFSPGNLQYHPANNVWQFAANQTDYIGYANANISSTYDGWIDLFGWSTAANNFGVSTSKDYEDYSGSFVDWGTNKIGNDAPNVWRTLNRDEWNYLLNTRTNASDLRGIAQVNGVNGLIFLPDTWVCPAGVTFKSGFHSNLGAEYYAAYQTFTAEQWSKMESAGAIFLPTAGFRDGSDVYNVRYDGYYWSATERNSYGAYFLNFYSDAAYMRAYYYDRYYGQSVRLVKDL